MGAVEPLTLAQRSSGAALAPEPQEAPLGACPPIAGTSLLEASPLSFLDLCPPALHPTRLLVEVCISGLPPFLPGKPGDALAPFARSAPRQNKRIEKHRETRYLDLFAMCVTSNSEEK